MNKNEFMIHPKSDEKYEILVNRFLGKFLKINYQEEEFILNFTGWRSSDLAIEVLDNSGNKEKFQLMNFTRKDIVKIHGNNFKNSGFVMQLQLNSKNKLKIYLKNNEREEVNFKINVLHSRFLNFFNSFTEKESHQSKYFAHIDSIYMSYAIKFKKIVKGLYWTFFVAFEDRLLRHYLLDSSIFDNTIKNELLKKFPWETVDDSTFLKRSLYLSEDAEIDSKLYFRKEAQRIEYDQDGLAIINNGQLTKARFISTESAWLYSDDSWDLGQKWIAGLHRSLVYNPNSLRSECWLEGNHITEERIDSGIFTPSKEIRNFWHFMFDVYIPIFNYINKNKVSDPILLDGAIHKNYIELIKQTIPNKIILLDPNKNYIIKELKVLKPVLSILDDPEMSLQIMTKAVNEIKVFQRDFKQTPNFKSDTSYKKICFSRDNKTDKSVTNIYFTKFILKIFGYKIVDPGTLSFKDQLELVTGTRSLIIFGGAATAHLIFSKSSTRAVIISSKVNTNFAGYEVFKELSESDVFIEGIGESRYTVKQIKEGHNPNYLDTIHLSFRVNLRQFIKILVREHKFLKHHEVLQQRP